MKRYFFSAIALTLTTATIAPVASATDFEPTALQQQRYETLDRGGSKAVDNIQSTRLEQLDTQSKAVEDIQSARLEQLDTQSKAVEDIQGARLEALDARTKQQVSTPAEISDDATFHDLVRFNRRARNKAQ